MIKVLRVYIYVMYIHAIALRVRRIENSMRFISGTIDRVEKQYNSQEHCFVLIQMFTRKILHAVRII